MLSITKNNSCLHLSANNSQELQTIKITHPTWSPSQVVKAKVVAARIPFCISVHQMTACVTFRYPYATPQALASWWLDRSHGHMDSSWPCSKRFTVISQSRANDRSEGLANNPGKRNTHACNKVGSKQVCLLCTHLCAEYPLKSPQVIDSRFNFAALSHLSQGPGKGLHKMVSTGTH